MGFTWQWRDRQSGELHSTLEPGEPCVCVGEDLPHPDRLCARVRIMNNPAEIERIRERAESEWFEDTGFQDIRDGVRLWIRRADGARYRHPFGPVPDFSQIQVP